MVEAMVFMDMFSLLIMLSMIWYEKLNILCVVLRFNNGVNSYPNIFPFQCRKCTSRNSQLRTLVFHASALAIPLAEALF